MRYADEALVAATELSDRYITDRFLPAKGDDPVDWYARSGCGPRCCRDVRDLERRAEELQRDKDQAIASEQYERAPVAGRDREVRGQIDQLAGDQSAVPESAWKTS